MNLSNIDWGAAAGGAMSGAAAGSAIPGVGTLLGGFIGGMSGIGSSYYEEQSQIRAEQRQEERQIRAEQRANAEYDRRFDKNAEYNSPTAQANRLAQAGINPIHALAKSAPGSATSPNISQSASPLGAGIKSKGPLSAVDMMSMARLKAEIDNINADTEQKKSQTDLNLEHIVGVRLANDIKDLEKMFLDATFEDRVALTDADFQKAKETIENLKIERENLIKEGKIDDKQLEVMDASIKKLESETELNSAIKALRESDIQVNEEQIERFRTQNFVDLKEHQRLKSQGLAALRLDAAQLGLDKQKFDWDKIRVEIEQGLKQEGLNIDWSKLGQQTLSAIGWALAIFFSRGTVAGAKGATKIVSNIIRRAPKFP